MICNLAGISPESHTIHHPLQLLITKLASTMSSQTDGGEEASPAQTNQKSFLDEVILTFSSPMAWLLVVALIITWSGVAIVLFDLLDYKTLTGPQVSSSALLPVFPVATCSITAEKSTAAQKAFST
ncbi:hypothetical protein ABVT39_021268 [Epinephelus coioides]